MELLIVESIRNVLEDSNRIFEEKNKKYYRDVLDFLNLMFEDNSTSLLKIKFKKITINSNVFFLYNEIIKKYKLNKPEIEIDKFDDIMELNDANEIKQILCDIAIKLSNNLLEHLNYKLKKKTNKNDDKIKFVLEYIK